jgi:hypothetical protein
MAEKTATINVLITQFRPLGSVMAISADMTLGAHDPEITMPDNTKSVRMRLKPADTAKLTFRLATDDYLLIGIAFSRRDPVLTGANAGDNAAQIEFPEVVITTVAGANGAPGKFRHMTLTNAHVAASDGAVYDYAIVVQHAHNGVIGIIDPDIETESAT